MHVNSTHGVLTTKMRKSTQILDESSFGRNIYSTCHLIVSRWHSLVATWFTLLNSSLTLWTCTKSQKDGQNHKNTGVRRAFSHKCPSRRANPSLDGRLSNTGNDDFLGIIQGTYCVRYTLFYTNVQVLYIICSLLKLYWT